MGLSTSHLLAVNASHSVMLKVTAPSLPVAYCPYGTLNSSDRRQGLPAFNGMLLEGGAQGYLLGNGYPLYRPQLRRFTRPDEFSPFGRGGLNGYAYCEGDPVNHVDPTGQGVFSFIGNLASMLIQHSRTVLFGAFAHTAYGVVRAAVTPLSATQMLALRFELGGLVVAAYGLQISSPAVSQMGMGVWAAAAASSARSQLSAAGGQVQRLIPQRLPTWPELSETIDDIFGIAPARELRGLNGGLVDANNNFVHGMRDVVARLGAIRQG